MTFIAVLIKQLTIKSNKHMNLNEILWIYYAIQLVIILVLIISFKLWLQSSNNNNNNKNKQKPLFFSLLIASYLYLYQYFAGSVLFPSWVYAIRAFYKCLRKCLLSPCSTHMIYEFFIASFQMWIFSYGDVEIN